MNSENSDSKHRTFVVAITGASGSAYGLRLLQVLLRSGCTLHVVFSSAAHQVMQRELGCVPPSINASAEESSGFVRDVLASTTVSSWGFGSGHAPDIEGAGSLEILDIRDFSAGIASGSFLTDGMVICPCSMGTLSALAHGTSTNLIHRAADVHMKERRRLIVVPREMPIGLIGLRNMTALTEAGATVMPAMPGFYQNPQSIADLVDFVVARICDHLGIQNSLIDRWGSN